MHAGALACVNASPARLPCSPPQALIASLGRADALGEALPLLDAWLQQQEEALEEDAATHAPLQARAAGAGAGALGPPGVGRSWMWGWAGTA